MSPALKPRVLLLIPHLGGGGAERVTALLARGLPRERYELHLALVTGPSVTEEERAIAAAGVEIHSLGARRVRGGIVPLLRLVRFIEPDLILSGMAHLNFVVLAMRSLFRRRTRIVVRQNSTASAALEFGGLPRYTRMLYRCIYRWADCIVCQTAAMSRDLASQFGIPDEKLVVLPNPVDLVAIRAETCGEGELAIDPCWRFGGPRLVAVGRLSKEKGFDLLIRSMSAIREIYADAELVIAGVGPEEASLNGLIRETRCGDFVRLAGHVARVSALFRSATLFVLSSRHEGLPNVLLEAAAAGLPMVSTPASEGVVDLLRGKPGVWLASQISESALTEALLTALRSILPGERFAHAFVERFGLDRSITAYVQLIDAVLCEGRR